MMWLFNRLNFDFKTIADFSQKQQTRLL